MEKSEIANHFQKEGYPRRTIYNTINHFHNEESIKDKKQTGRQTSWTSTRKNKLKRLTNNRRGISQRWLGRKFNISHMTICRQLSKMPYLVLNVRKRLNTQRNRQGKQRIWAKNLLTYYTDRNAAWFWTMKNTLLLMAQTWMETTTPTRMTSQIVQIVFVSLEKRSFRQK